MQAGGIGARGIVYGWDFSGDPGHVFNAIVDGSGDAKLGVELRRGGELNVKRYARRDLSEKMWRGAEAENPYWILDTVEMKTAWHPIGL